MINHNSDASSGGVWWNWRGIEGRMGNLFANMDGFICKLSKLFEQFPSERMRWHGMAGLEMTNWARPGPGWWGRDPGSDEIGLTVLGRRLDVVCRDKKDLRRR